jgi:hypothetical protein
MSRQNIKFDIMNDETKAKFKTWVDLLPADGVTRLPERELFFDFVLTAFKHRDSWNATELDCEGVISDFPNQEDIYAKTETLFQYLTDFYTYIQNNNNQKK